LEGNLALDYATNGSPQPKLAIPAAAEKFQKPKVAEHLELLSYFVSDKPIVRVFQTLDKFNYGAKKALTFLIHQLK
jgi:hypothetical protein